MKKTITLSLLASLALSVQLFGAQEQKNTNALNVESPKKSDNLISDKITVDGKVRFRLEQFDGWNQRSYGDTQNKKKPIGNSDDTVLMQQVIAGFTYKHSDEIIARLSMKDSRAHGWSLSESKMGNDFWGQNGYVMNPQEEYFEVYDAHVEVKNLMTKGLTAKIGRQSIEYGDKRIFGPGLFGNTGRWHWDAAKFDYKWDNNFVAAWYGGTKLHDPLEASFPDGHEYRGAGLYTHFETTKTGAFEPFAATKEGQLGTTKDTDHYWLGARLYDQDLYNFYYDFTYAHQGGNKGDIDTDAYGYVGMVGYQFKEVAWKPKIDYTHVYASGTSNADKAAGKNSTFDFAYGANDWVFGWMNIVSWSNIIDDEIKVTFKPTDKMVVLVDHHFYKLAEAEQGMTTIGRPGASLGLYDDVGQESNLEVRYQYNKDLQIRAWYCYFQPGDVIKTDNKDKGGSNNASWMAMQVEYKFSL